MTDPRRVRYHRFDGGADPLASPFDASEALDALSDEVLSGVGTDDALRELLRRGLGKRQGLTDLAREARRREQALRERGRLDGTLDDIRGLLDDAIEAERNELFPDPSDEARFREAQLAALPQETARAVRELADYDWRSDQAREQYEQIRELLQQEVLSQQFEGMRQALREAPNDPKLQAAIAAMIGDLNELLGKRAAGSDTQQDFDEFIAKHGQFFPEQPQNLDELIEGLARSAAAADRLMQSLSQEQREELADLMQQTREQLGLDGAMAELDQNLRGLRPDLFRRGPEQMTGERPLGLGDATQTLAELSDLEALREQLGQSYAGASMEDIDEELVQRALGRQALDDVRELQRIQRELEAQGYLVRNHGELELTPKAVRRLGLTALRRVFSDLEPTSRGMHDVRGSGGSGERTGATRAWTFGDEQPIDVAATLVNAVRHSSPGEPLHLTVDDFEVVETERRSIAAVSLLVDTSYSMVVNDTWGQAKQTAMALHALVSTMYPQDAMQIVGFGEYARQLQPHELAGLDFAMVQGTNLQHALMLAGRFLDRHPGYEPVVLVITDGEPTARLLPDGVASFAWPPEPETLAVTVAEVDKMTRRKASLNVFMLGEDERLQEFVDDVAARNGGRVFTPDPDRLGEFVLRDFLTRRNQLARGHQ